MCIIVAKPKEAKLPKKEYLENSFSNNDDGAGFMYVNNGAVVIEKGFMTWKEFEKRYDNLCRTYNNFENMSFVAHFRIGTQGKNDKHTCHPFPVSSNYKKLRKTYIKTDLGMVHNGIIGEYSKNYLKYNERVDKLLSDTQLFIKYCVNAFKSLNRNFYKNEQVMTCLDKLADGKLCFLDSEDNLYMLGKYEVCDGIYYSNSTYSYDFTQYYKSYNTLSTHSDYPIAKIGEDGEIEYDSYMYEDDLSDYYITEVSNLPNIHILEKGDGFILDGRDYISVRENDMYVYDDLYGYIYKLNNGILAYYSCGDVMYGKKDIGEE